MNGPLARRFRCCLVVGKFCPLHLGHEWLIRQALAACDEVVVIGYAKPGFQGYGRDRRQAWLTSRFPEALSLVIDDDSLAGRCRASGIAQFPLIPPDDAPDDEHRVFVAWLCGTLLRKRIDSVFTSEDYGDGFADVLSERFGYRVEHVCVDRARAKFPVSGTRIRSDPHGCREYLAPEIYADFVRKICLLGGESSGKTSLAVALARSLDTLVVPEYGRTLWVDKQGELQFPDMLHIARTQIGHENEMAQRANRFLICDTSPLTTFLYSDVMFGQVDPELAQLAGRHYDLVFLCAPDFDFVQDETRRDDEFRMYQHRWYEAELARRGVPYIVLSGTMETRLIRAVSVVRVLR
ncbi:MAG: AAA family ATPase [Azoarcus sp.]|jgi:NadR type nicotinamide-nucleotide adenylyltransferase|nr:AAA family ATPase [Azoarcus sp.]